MSNTVFLLMAEYGTSRIPLEHCCHLCGLSPGKAKQYALLAKLPVTAFRAQSQKAPWLVHADDLAVYLDAQRKTAQDGWNKLNAA